MNIYKKIFLESFRLAFSNWRWWFFGFFAAFFTNSIEIDLFDNFFNTNKNILITINSAITQSWLWPLNLSRLDFSSVDWLIVAKMLLFASVLLIISVLVVFAAISSQLILIKKAADANQGKSTDQSNHPLKLWPLIKQYFSTALLVNLSLKVFIYLLFFLIMLPLVLKTNLPLAAINIIYIVLFVSLVALAVVTSMVFKLAITAMVVKEIAWLQAIKDAWQLFKNNWVSTIEISLSLFLATVVGSFIAILLIFAISIPINLSMVVISSFYRPSYLIFQLVTYLLSFSLFFVMIAFIGCFNTISWTNFYLLLDKNGQKINFFSKNKAAKK